MVIHSSDQVLRLITQHKGALKQFGVRHLGLFGSYSRGQNRTDSDLDFLVELEKKSFDSYMGLKIYLENLFERPVDLVLKDSLKPRLRENVLKEVVYAEGL